ncbi:hypothetical protein JNW88_22395 [Micromonospora sp. ATA32]|nr:hypothetical protein [Micromonospora sp. ATA32]
MRIDTGQVIMRRYHRGGRCAWMQPMRVIADDDGRTQHDLPIDAMHEPRPACPPARSEADQPPVGCR